MPVSSWEPHPHGSHVLMGAMSLCPTFLWEPHCRGAHVLVGATSSWFPHPCGTHPRSAHILMPMSSWNSSAPGCSEPNPGCLGQEETVLTEPRWYQERYQLCRLKMQSHQHLALSLQRPCWVPGQPRGWREEEKGSACPCLVDRASASPIQGRSDPLQGLQDGRGSSSGTVLHPSAAVDGRTDTWTQSS